jgi:hypothetical protein
MMQLMERVRPRLKLSPGVPSRRHAAAPAPVLDSQEV